MMVRITSETGLAHGGLGRGEGQDKPPTQRPERHQPVPKDSVVQAQQVFIDNLLFAEKNWNWQLLLF